MSVLALNLRSAPPISPSVNPLAAGPAGVAAVKTEAYRSDRPQEAPGYVGAGGMGGYAVDPGYAPGMARAPLTGQANIDAVVEVAPAPTRGPGTRNIQPVGLRAGVLQQLRGYNPPAPGSILPYVAKLTGTDTAS